MHILYVLCIGWVLGMQVICIELIGLYVRMFIPSVNEHCGHYFIVIACLVKPWFISHSNFSWWHCACLICKWWYCVLTFQETFDEFYAKLKDIVNSTFNFREIILEPKIVRKMLRSLPDRFHAKITAIEESKDIDKIPLTELVGNLQTYELGLTRIGKLSKGKSKTLKTKSSDTDESLDNEDSKMKSYITRQFKKFMKNANWERPQLVQFVSVQEPRQREEGC